MGNLDYGVIGNCRSAAMVSAAGSMDWCCLPDFTSASVFAALLDTDKGGRFAFDLPGEAEIEQHYLERTNILATRFQRPEGAFEVVDFMPRYKTDDGHYHCPPDVVRLIRRLSGRPRFRVRYEPRLGYARFETRTVPDHGCLKSFTTSGQYESVYLYSSLDLHALHHGEWMELEHDAFLLLSYNQKLLELDLHRVVLEFERTKVYWLDWVERSVRFARHNEEIIRSALVLKLLTYHKTGAILAAVTTSLPETVGGVRNWDYRFCWIRDASMTISMLTALGHHNAAQRFLSFIVDVIPYKDEKIQIMYGIRGEKKLIERELPWLAGHEGSRPVRVGNAAYLQKQNDIYGVLIDVIYRYFRVFRHTLANSEELWGIVRGLVRTVRYNWMIPDKGIWELRSQRRQFTFSKVLCWVAMDRGVKIAEMLGRHALAAQWARVREGIRRNILAKGWNPRVEAFTQYYGGDDLDASNLLMPFYGFLDPQDPRYVATVRRTHQELSRDGLMYRYKNPDDFGLPQSSFTVCTFWMIKSLYLIGEREEAQRLFADLLGYANHLGLFSEGIEFQSKRLTGNFPQGYSHLALIDTAITLAGGRVDEDSRILKALQTPGANGPAESAGSREPAEPATSTEPAS
jgi:GH15 family glucan-1,4-alpha-glucosidase